MAYNDVSESKVTINGPCREADFYKYDIYPRYQTLSKRKLRVFKKESGTKNT